MSEPPGALALRELWWESLRLGLVGFGGGLTVLSALERVAVTRRRWLTAEQYESAATVSQILPGGAAANALALIGLRTAGMLGAVVGYVGFILPGCLAILGLAWVYVRFGAIPHAAAFLDGLNAGVVGVILALTLRLGKGGVTRPWQMAVAAAALLLSAVGETSSGELALMGVGVGLLLKVAEARGLPLGHRPGAPRPPPPPPPPTDTGSGTLRALVAPVGLAVLLPALLGSVLVMATVFFRTGLSSYGGGFAIIPSLHLDVQARGWLTEQQFSDAVAVGKLTPGPVLLMATFIGYVADGLPGALAATVGIFSGPLLLTVLFGSTLERLRDNPWVQAGLAGLSATVVGLMAAAALTLGMGLHGILGAAIATAVALTLALFPVNPVALLGVGGLVSVALSLLGR